MDRPATILVVSLCGLPGAGKSTLCNSLVVAAVSGAIDVEVVHISFDQAQSRFVGADWTPETWHCARTTALCSAQSAVAAAGPTVRRLVLLDDNAWFRSMRREAYCLARASNGRTPARCAYATLYLTCPLDLALSRDSSRPEHARVGAGVITRMHAALQRPHIGAGQGDWESPHAVQFDASAGLDSLLARVLSWLGTGAGPHSPWAACHVPSWVGIGAEHRERARADADRTAQDALHQGDLLLRRAVSSAMARASALDRRALALSLQTARSAALEELRETARCGVLSVLVEGQEEEADAECAWLPRLAELVHSLWDKARQG